MLDLLVGFLGIKNIHMDTKNALVTHIGLEICNIYVLWRPSWIFSTGGVPVACIYLVPSKFQLSMLRLFLEDQILTLLT